MSAKIRSKANQYYLDVYYRGRREWVYVGPDLSVAKEKKKEADHGWYEWNSCTTNTCCDPPDPNYYNADNSTHQATTQGNNTFGNTYYCWPLLAGHEDEGCSYL